MMVSQLNRTIRVLERENVGGNHQARANNCRSGAIDAEAGQTSDSQDDIGREKDQYRRHFLY
jgi:hypothetical protein